VLDSLAEAAAAGGFLPHGYCLAWRPELVAALVAGNLIVAAAYYSIPVALLWFRHRNPDLRYGWLATVFGAFIFACGTTHVIDVVNLWRPVYRLDAAVMLVTAAISAVTAISLWWVMPRLNDTLRFNIRARAELAELNEQLSQTVHSLQMRTEELARSEQRFRLTFHQSPIGMALVELNGHFARANASLCTLLGYREEQLQQMDFQSITHPDDLSADLNNVDDLLSGRRECYQMEKRYVASEGRLVHVQLDVGLLRDPEGAPLHFIAQIQDITLRRQLEEQRRLTEEEMRRLLEHLGTAVVVHGPDTGVRYANPAALEILGLTKDQILGRQAIGMHWRFVRPDGTAMPPEEFPVNRVRETKAPLGGCELGVITEEGGEPRWVLVYGFPELDASAQVTRFIMSFIDISERRRLLEELDRQARHDPLTGLPNRRHFMEQAEREVQRSRRTGAPLSLLMIDLDHFKIINDRHGHAAGDEVLRIASGIFQDEVRVQDATARLGGEEFAVLCTDGNAEGAGELGDRILRRLRQAVISVPGNPCVRITASIGVSMLRNDGVEDDILGMLARADAALYAAKARGRDRMEFQAKTRTLD